MTEYIIINGELYHHGVKGMKWGVRRTEAQLGRDKKKAEKDARKAEDEDRRQAVKNRKTMSDAELQKRVQRLEMEKKLKTLSKEDESAGKKAVTKALSATGKIAGTALGLAATAIAVYSIRHIFEKKLTPSRIKRHPKLAWGIYSKTYDLSEIAKDIKIKKK